MKLVKANYCCVKLVNVQLEDSMLLPMCKQDILQAAIALLVLLLPAFSFHAEQ